MPPVIGLQEYVINWYIFFALAFSWVRVRLTMIQGLAGIAVGETTATKPPEPDQFFESWLLPPKGKAPTKGAKQILSDNVATVSFYRNMALGAGSFYCLPTCILFYQDLTTGIIFMNILVISIYIGCYQMMKYISKARFTEDNQLLDPGLDLNMEGGMGEHIKDIVILTSITHVLAVVSNYFWFLLLLLPLRAAWLLWTNVLGPWFFQEAPQDNEQDDKKKKKMERKMKRYQQ